MSRQKWLDAAQELGKVRDQLFTLADVWEDEKLKATLKMLAEWVNVMGVLPCYKKAMAAE